MTSATFKTTIGLFVLPISARNLGIVATPVPDNEWLYDPSAIDFLVLP